MTLLALAGKWVLGVEAKDDSPSDVRCNAAAMAVQPNPVAAFCNKLRRSKLDDLLPGQPDCPCDASDLRDIDKLLHVEDRMS